MYIYIDISIRITTNDSMRITNDKTSKIAHHANDYTLEE